MAEARENPYTELIYSYNEDNNSEVPIFQSRRQYLVEYNGIDTNNQLVQAHLLGIFNEPNNIASFQPVRSARINNDELIDFPLPPQSILNGIRYHRRFNNFSQNIKRIYQEPEPASPRHGGYKRKSKKVRKGKKGRKGRKGRKQRKTKKYFKNKIETI